MSKYNGKKKIASHKKQQQQTHYMYNMYLQPETWLKQCNTQITHGGTPYSIDNIFVVMTLFCRIISWIITNAKKYVSFWEVFMHVFTNEGRTSDVKTNICKWWNNSTSDIHYLPQHWIVFWNGRDDCTYTLLWRSGCSLQMDHSAIHVYGWICMALDITSWFLTKRNFVR